MQRSLETGKTGYRGDWSVLTHGVKCMLNQVPPPWWISGYSLRLCYKYVWEIPCVSFYSASEQTCSLRLCFKNKKLTACAFDWAFPPHTAVNSCEYLKVNWGEIAAEIFDPAISVSSSYNDSPQVTLFGATQMARPHKERLPSGSHLVCKMAPYRWEFCSETARHEEGINLDPSDYHLKGN